MAFCTLAEICSVGETVLVLVPCVPAKTIVVVASNITMKITTCFFITLSLNLFRQYRQFLLDRQSKGNRRRLRARQGSRSVGWCYRDADEPGRGGAVALVGDDRIRCADTHRCKLTNSAGNGGRVGAIADYRNISSREICGHLCRDRVGCGALACENRGQIVIRPVNRVADSWRCRRKHAAAAGGIDSQRVHCAKAHCVVG